MINLLQMVIILEMKMSKLPSYPFVILRGIHTPFILSIFQERLSKQLIILPKDGVKLPDKVYLPAYTSLNLD